MGTYVIATLYVLVGLAFAFLLARQVEPLESLWRMMAMWTLAALGYFFFPRLDFVLLFGAALAMLLAPSGQTQRIAFVLVAVTALPTFIEEPLPLPGVQKLLVATHYKLVSLVLLGPLLFAVVPRRVGMNGRIEGDIALPVFFLCTAAFVTVYLSLAAAISPHLPFALPLPTGDASIVLTHDKIGVLLLVVPLFCFGLAAAAASRRLALCDVMMALFVAHAGAINAITWNATTGLRFFVDQLLELFLPFVVIPRLIRSSAGAERLVRAFLVASLILAAIALVAALKQWDFYKIRATGLPAVPDFRSGWLRTEVTANTHSLGFHLALALLFLGYARRRFRIALAPLLVLGAVLLLGMAAANSRGSMLGLAVGIVIYRIVLLRNAALRAICVGAAVLAGVGLGVWLVTADFGFLGATDTFSYRQQLLITVLAYIWDHPLYGDLFHGSNERFAHLIQGQGIVDITNLFLLLPLQYGVVGAGFYFAAFLIPVFGLARLRLVARGRGASNAPADDLVRLRAAVLAGSVGWLALVATTSNVGLTTHLGVVLAVFARITMSAARQEQQVPVGERRPEAALMAPTAQAALR